jgi:hypothetical protein
MIDLYIVLGMGLIFAVVAFAERRRRRVVDAENEKLRDQLMGSEQKVEVEKLKDKLAADEKLGKPSEEAFDSFRRAHPELFPPGKS